MLKSALKVHEKKKNVILVPGPLYLFWTTGLYYLWELSRNYRVVLIVDETYSKDEVFLKSIGLTDVAEVIYMPDSQTSYARHKFYYSEFKRIVEAYQPVFIFQYNDAYINNLYLFHMKDVLGLDCKRLVFQNAREAFNWEEDYKVRVDLAISKEQDRLGFRIPARLSRWRIRLTGLLGEFKDYYLLPWLVAGKALPCVLDLHSGKFRYKGNALREINKKRFDLYLAYYAVEKETIESLQGYSGDIRLVAHPVKTVGSECNKVMYNIEEENIISLFPSYGFVNSLSLEKGISPDEVAEEVADKWISAINILLKRFPGSKVVWKLHPNAASDPVMEEISKQVKKGCSGLEVLRASDNAQKWVLKSKVVVTDVSTVFWWANMLKDKIVVSLDIFGYPGGDEAKYYDGVHYFRTIEELESFDFGSSVSLGNKPALPTITEVCAKLIDRSVEQVPVPEG